MRPPGLVSIDCTAIRGGSAEAEGRARGAAFATVAVGSAAGFDGGSGTATGIAFEVCVVPDSPVATDRLCAPGASAGGMMTKLPSASAFVWARVLPASSNATWAFGAARPATTVSPVGSTFTTSKAGLTGGGAAGFAAGGGAEGSPGFAAVAATGPGLGACAAGGGGAFGLTIVGISCGRRKWGSVQ